jgi:DnaJ-class molecular chaperone
MTDSLLAESVRAAQGEGMPKPNSMERGNLYVAFEVVFPPAHFLPTEAQYKKLEPLLPIKRPAVPQPPKGVEVEEVSLVDYDPRRYEHGSKSGGREAYHESDSDDDMMGGGPGPSGMGGAQRVQCAQQ